MSDINAAIRRDLMAGELGQFLRRAEGMGATASEALSALVDKAGAVYAEALAGAGSRREKKAALAAFKAAMVRTLNDLPTEAKDKMIERKLEARGYGKSG